MRQEFNGRDMAKILVIGFGVVVGVNLLMATLAARNFSGVVVENSYVASQKFNGWLEESRKSDDLGWAAKPSRDGAGHLSLATTGVPKGALVTAQLRRPLGAREEISLSFAETSDSTFHSAEVLPSGRWIARVSIRADGQNWIDEAAIE